MEPGEKNLIAIQYEGRTAAVGGNASTTAIPVADRTYLASQWAGGIVYWLTGVNAGSYSAIADNTPTQLSLTTAVTNTPAAGDLILLLTPSEANGAGSQLGQLVVSNGTVPIGAIWDVTSGNEVAFNALTVDGTIRVDGTLLVDTLTVDAGGVTIYGPSSTVIVGAFD